MSDMRLFQRNGIYYTEINREKRSLKTKDAREAKRLFNLAKKEYLRGRIVKLDNSERITLEEFGKEYIESRGDLDHDTLRMDSLALRSLGRVIGDKTPVRLINDKVIAKFTDACLKRGLSKHSINTYLRHIKAALNAACNTEYIKEAPKVRMVKTGKHLPRILAPEEINSILAHSEKNDPEMWRIILFALWTGSRQEEILNVAWQNVMWDIQNLRIRGKGDKDRTIPLLPKALEAMGEPKNIGPVFKQWHKNTLSHRFKRIAVACGIEDAHFHNLRHTSATQMLKSGIPLEVVQKILGHVDIRTTQIYAQVVDSFMASEMQKLQF